MKMVKMFSDLTVKHSGASGLKCFLWYCGLANMKGFICRKGMCGLGF